MKQVLQARNSSAVVRDVPRPLCSPGGVLVRTAYSVISSGTERNRVELSQKSLIGKARERPDLVREVVQRARREGFGTTSANVRRKLAEETPVGYSCAGRVLEVGEHVREIRPGDTVACAGAGYANHAEIVSVPANLCVPVPNGVSAREAAFTTIAAIALQGVRLADVRLGERVAVIGCGLIGQIALRLLRSAGAVTYAVDLDATRLDDAVGGGADHAFEASLALDGIIGHIGVGVDAVLVTAASSSSDPLRLAAEIARDRGIVVLVGAVPIEVPREPMYAKELTLRVSRSYGPGRYDSEYEERGLDYPIGYVRWSEQRNMSAIVQLLARDQLKLEDLIDEEFTVDSAEEAYARLIDAERPLRGAIVLSYPDDGSHPPGSRGVVAAQASSPEISATNSGGQARLGLIGAGNFAGRVIVPAFVDAGARLEAVAGGAGPSAEAAARSLGFARVLPDPETLLHDEGLDVVVICTRHGSHADLVVQGLQAGKHVFCEKPLALSEKELQEVLDAAVSSRRVLAVGFNRRFSPLLVTACNELAHAGRRMTMVYRVSAGSLDSDHWTHDLAEGGGRAIGEGCHFLDCLTYLAGSPIVTVHALGYSSNGHPIQAWDNLVITLGFESGSVGTVSYVADGSGRLPKERLEAFCGDRTIVLDDYRELTIYKGRKQHNTKTRTQDKGHHAEIAAFLEGARTGNPPVSLSEIANVSAASLAIIESLRTGAPVAVHGTKRSVED